MDFCWEDMGHAAVEGISTAMGAIFILLAVGALGGYLDDVGDDRHAGPPGGAVLKR